MASAGAKDCSTVLLPHRAMRNVYVLELGRSYARQAVRPLFGPSNLLESTFVPDLVHVHWPEEVYRWPQTGTLSERVDRFLARLDEWRAEGARIAWTVHNLEPHEIVDRRSERRAYQGLIDRADVIHHHCPESERLLRSKYRVPPEQRRVVVPHGRYLSYRNEMSGDEARRSLGIDPNAFVYLHFGQIRAYKGLDLVEHAFASLQNRNRQLFVVGSCNLKLSPAERLRFFARRKCALKSTYVLEAVRDDEVQRYVNACDALVLGHTSGLNSGVAALGMSFGKPVVGPRHGCIAWMLAQGLNVAYDPGNLQSLVEAMKAVTRLDPSETASRNRRAASSWRWETIAKSVMDACSIRPDLRESAEIAVQDSEKSARRPYREPAPLESRPH